MSIGEFSGNHILDADLSFYVRKGTGEADPLVKDVQLSGPLIESLACHLKRIAAYECASNLGRLRTANDIRRIFGGEANVYWAYTLGLVRREAGGEDYYIEDLVSILYSLCATSALDSRWGQRWYHHYCAATNLGNPESYEVINKILLGPKITDKSSENAFPNEQAIMATYESGYFSRLGLAKDRGEWPRSLAKNLFYYVVARRMLEHLRKVKSANWKPSNLPCSEKDFPIAALWFVGNPAYVFALNTVAVWDTLVGQRRHIDPLYRGTKIDYPMRSFLNSLADGNRAFFPGLKIDGVICARIDEDEITEDQISKFLQTDVDPIVPSMDEYASFIAGNYVDY